MSIYRLDRDGGREAFVEGIVNATSLAMSPDGVLHVSSRYDGAVYRIAPDGRAETLVSDLGVACGLAFAPDGSLFVGDRTGTIHRVSGGGASSLAWHDDGSVLFYRSPNPAGGGSLIAVPVRLLPDRVEIGTAQTLLSSQFGDTANVSADGQSVLLFAWSGETSENDSNPLTVLVNWQAALK